MTIEQLNERAKNLYYNGKEDGVEVPKECPVFQRNGSHSALAMYIDEEGEYTDSLIMSLMWEGIECIAEEADDEHTEVTVEVEDE